MKSTITRSFPEASPLRKAVGIDILQIEEEQQQQKQRNLKKRSNTVESKIVPVVLSKPTSPATQAEA
jgi:hypothetical protein